MKVGQKVNLYFPADSSRVTATVEEIVGGGESGAKLLKLSYTEDGSDFELEEVPYRDDAAEGSAFWLPKGERVPAGWDEGELADDIVAIEPTPLVEEPVKTPAKKKGRKRS